MSTWNADFKKTVPQGTAGNQAQFGIFYTDYKGRIKRLVEAEGNEISYNPETEERNPIGQEAPSTLVRTYNLSFDKDIIIKKGALNYEFFSQWKRMRPDGDNAKLRVYLVDFRLEQVGTNHNDYYTEMMDVTCTVNSANETDATLSLSFVQDGDYTIGTIGRNDTRTSDDETTFSYEFIPSTKIPIVAIITSIDDDSSGSIEREIDLDIDQEKWVEVSFSPLACPFGFTVASEDESVVTARRKLQSVILKGRSAGTTTVKIISDTVKASAAVEDKTLATIEVIVS